MDFDPRDYDSRDRDEPDREERPSERDERSRDRAPEEQLSALPDDARRPDDDARTLDRSPDDTRSRADGPDGHDPRDEARGLDRDRDAPGRDFDPREPFTRDLDLPRGPEREVVHDRDRDYSLRGSETRTLSTVGAFRVVSSRDLRGHDERPLDPRSGDLRHLRDQGLVETARVPGSREHAVALTREGRSLLEHHRNPDQGNRQTFWHGLAREREREHDLQVYRAYERAAERLWERGARVERVVLDHELKREYQRWLHASDRARADHDGRPDRSQEEIREWARERDLPYFDDKVHFPDVRLEYLDMDDREHHEDVEVTTEHYRGAHARGVGRSGFSCYGGSSARVGGRSAHPRLAEQMLR